MSDRTKGSCLCGASKLAFEGDANFAIRCFCGDCRQISGGGHMPQMGVAAAGFSASGPIKSYSKTSDSGSALVFSFCGDCGSPLFKTTSKMPDTVFVNAGPLEQVKGGTQFKNVYESGRQDWDVG